LLSALLAPLASRPRPAAAQSEAAAEDQRGGERSLLAACGSQPLVIGRVEIVAKDIFDANDPAEDRRAFRWADRLHKTTGEGVIRSALLFHAGEPFSRQRLEESERLLRARSSWTDVSIVPIGCHEGVVDVQVTTHDTWTLGGGVKFGRSGGQSSLGFEVSDSNFLGTGKEVLLRYERGVDRSGYETRYVDPALFGSRNELRLSYVDNDDGGSWLLEAGRPFFSLETRWSAGGRVLHDRRTDRLYSRGRIVDAFSHVQDFVEVSGGWSAGLGTRGVGRYRLGFTGDRHAFADAPDESTEADRAGDEAAGDLRIGEELPLARTLAYPWIGFELLQDDFLEAVDLDQIGRIEDRYLGTHVTARLGYSSSLFGADRGRVIASAAWSTAWRPRERVLFEVGAEGRGRYGQGSAEDVQVSGRATLHWRDFGEQLLYFHLAGDYASDLDRDHQLLLGGDSGLRGYPLRFQAGDRRFLMTIEQRVFTDWYPWHLFRVGGAAFVDVGRAWFAGGRQRVGDGLDGVLADVGVGLRLGLSRSGKGSTVHIDVAVPLERGDSLGGLQWLVSTRRSF
jgi:hypothetical protein